MGEGSDELTVNASVQPADKPLVQLHANSEVGPPNLPCPKCPGNLEAVIHDGVEIDICRLCHGLWFDQGELAKFNKFDSDFPLAPGKGRVTHRPGARCPRCRNRMKVVRYAPGANLEVDRCDNCAGVWLDRMKSARFNGLSRMNASCGSR